MARAGRPTMAIASMCLLLALPWGAGNAQPALIIEAEAANIAPTNVILVIWLSYARTPVRAWFELGKTPDLADAETIGTIQRDNGRGDVKSWANVHGLTPNTDYYFRAHVRMANGETATTQTDRFRTYNPDPAFLVRCRYASHERAQNEGRGGLQFRFHCGGPPLVVEAFLMTSPVPSMEGARDRTRVLVDIRQRRPERTVDVFLADNDVPGSDALYVQLRTETWWGNSQSDTVGITLGRNRPDKRP